METSLWPLNQDRAVSSDAGFGELGSKPIHRRKSTWSQQRLAPEAWAQPTAPDTDEFIARQAWLYVAIVAVGYMISRGLAKSGSREPYDADRDDRDSPRNQPGSTEPFPDTPSRG